MTTDILPPLIRYLLLLHLTQGRGDTVLMLSSGKGHTEVVKALLRVPGININHANVSVTYSISQNQFLSPSTPISLAL